MRRIDLVDHLAAALDRLGADRTSIIDREADQPHLPGHPRGDRGAIALERLLVGRPEPRAVGLDGERLWPPIGAGRSERPLERRHPHRAERARTGTDRPIAVGLGKLAHRRRVFLDEKPAPPAVGPGEDRQILPVAEAIKRERALERHCRRHPIGGGRDGEEEEPVAAIHHRGVGIAAEPGDSAQLRDRVPRSIGLDNLAWGIDDSCRLDPDRHLRRRFFRRRFRGRADAERRPERQGQQEANDAEPCPTCTQRAAAANNARGSDGRHLHRRPNLPAPAIARSPRGVEATAPRQGQSCPAGSGGAAVSKEAVRTADGATGCSSTKICSAGR